MNKKFLSGLLATLEISGVSMPTHAFHGSGSEWRESAANQNVETNQRPDSHVRQVVENIYRDNLGNEYELDSKAYTMTLVKHVSGDISEFPEYLEIIEDEPIDWDKEYEDRIKVAIEEESEWWTTDEEERNKKKEEISVRIKNEINTEKQNDSLRPIPLYKVIIPQKLNDELIDEIGLKYTLDEENNTAQVFRYQNQETEKVQIPKFIERSGKLYKVAQIDEYAFSYCRSLTSITIPDSITQIGDNAFEGCSALTSVTIPQSVTRIESYVFKGCSALTSITIPHGIKKIGSWAFWGCRSLISITIPESVTSIERLAFWCCNSLEEARVPNGTRIANNAFKNCPTKIIRY